jgi:hypothetical protein
MVYVFVVLLAILVVLLRSTIFDFHQFRFPLFELASGLVQDDLKLVIQ